MIKDVIIHYGGEMKEPIALDSDAFKNLIHASAALRGQGRFRQAIELVESKLGELHPDCYENAYLEIIYAAQEGRLPEVAKKYAQRLSVIDPDIPTVKTALGQKP